MMQGQHNLVSRIPLGRFGTADEVAQAVLMLLDNAYMTGQTVAMSGGMAFNQQAACCSPASLPDVDPVDVGDLRLIGQGLRGQDEVSSAGCCRRHTSAGRSRPARCPCTR